MFIKLDEMPPLSARIGMSITPPAVVVDGAVDVDHREEPANALEALRRVTKLVADSGDYRCFDKYKPVDATTNPSLILAAVKLGTYHDVVDAAIRNASQRKPDLGEDNESMTILCEELLVEFGCRMLEHVSGLVSVEVDPSLSFDTEASIHKARVLAGLFEARGIHRSRVAFKLASVWEGFEAAKVLEKEGIQCNMTLMFSMCQAIAAAEAGASIVSPYVGRVLEWHRTHGPEGVDYSGDSDPGVIGVKKIYNYYKRFGYKSLVMGASFRNIEEILYLAGCDNLTIAPKWLEKLVELPASVVHPQMDASKPVVYPGYEHKITLTGPEFNWALTSDQCAIEQLTNGLRMFEADWVELKGILKQRLREIHPWN